VVEDEHLYAFVADARARSAADVRRRTRWLAHQLREDATFADLCRDLGPCTAVVEVPLSDGRSHRGRLTGFGADVVELLTVDGGTVYIVAAATVGIRIVGTDPSLGHDEASDHAFRAQTREVVDEHQWFSDVLADLAGARARVVVGTVARRMYRGTLAGVGRDMVWFEDTQCYLRLQMITDVMVAP
jgi:small nuclear ribonucleoprotein (snRNP)-like protein